jgi:hypothetical protein
MNTPENSLRSTQHATARAESLRKLDHAGMAASILCAIHCIALPLLLGGLTATGVGRFRNEALEWAIVAGSFVIGLFALLPSYRRLHRHKRCLWLFGIGVLSILAGRFANARSLPDTPFIVCGATLIVSAHAANRFLCSRCGSCATEESGIAPGGTSTKH